MTNWDREKIIENAIREYKNSESKKSIENALNMMENVYIMCSLWSVKGIVQLKQNICEAENKLKRM